MYPNGKGSYLLHVQFVNGRKTKIVVDSGAEENVCPWEWGEEFGTQPLRWGEERNFKDASGNAIEHWGKRRVVVTTPFWRRDMRHCGVQYCL